MQVHTDLIRSQLTLITHTQNTYSYTQHSHTCTSYHAPLYQHTHTHSGLVSVPEAEAPKGTERDMEDSKDIGG